MPRRLPEDVTSKTMTTNDTWNECPRCMKAWKDIPAIPGIIHRIRYCNDCKEIMKNEVFGHMHEVKKNDN